MWKICTVWQQCESLKQKDKKNVEAQRKKDQGPGK
jgi:hypothetical protein